MSYCRDTTCPIEKDNQGVSDRITAQHVANFFLSKAREEGRSLDPIKLIKLIYIGYGWYLALTGKRLFSEPIQAWRHGPVIPSIYHEFKHYRSSPIEDYSTNFNLSTLEERVPQLDSTSDATAILQRVWDIYKRFSGWSLRNKTHETNTPWRRTYEENCYNAEIDDELIKDHFQEKIGQYLEAAKNDGGAKTQRRIAS